MKKLDPHRLGRNEYKKKQDYGSQNAEPTRHGLTRRFLNSRSSGLYGRGGGIVSSYRSGGGFFQRRLMYPPHIANVRRVFQRVGQGRFAYGRVQRLLVRRKKLRHRIGRVKDSHGL